MRDYKLYLDDIIEAADNILSFVADIDYDTFILDKKTQGAVNFYLEIIGEAARCLSAKIKHKATVIDWQKIAGLRNILVHEYFGINKVIIWDIVKNKVPQLKQECEKLRDL